MRRPGLRSVIAFTLALLVPAVVRAEPRARAEPNAAARAEPSTPLRLALIVGVNRSVDASAPVLHYADDDAARTFDLFETLGTTAEVLMRPDDNTRRLHERATRAARPPRLRELDASIQRLAALAGAARARGQSTVLYVFYAGHGNVDSGVGYISLEDARLTGKDLETRVLAAVRADRSHFVVDACHSYFLAYARGPGGQRRSLEGLRGFLTLGQRADVGVLLSTSSARESHEWERVQAGVFSHEVRSGLYGAADADGDGLVTYREMAAFVARANESIPNQRFRPDVYAHPPAGDGVLLDLRAALARRIEVDGGAPGRYQLENQNGTYLVEFHNAPGQSVHLVRPLARGRLYLERVGEQKEFVIDGEGAVVRTRELSLLEPHTLARGAEHEAFDRVFELPFGNDTVARFRYPAPPAPDSDAAAARGTSTRRSVGYGLLGAGVVGFGVGGYGLFSAIHAANASSAGSSQAAIADRNRTIQRGNWAAALGLGLGAAAATAGSVLLLWPDAPVTFEATLSPAQLGGALHARF